MLLLGRILSETLRRARKGVARMTKSSQTYAGQFITDIYMFNGMLLS